MGTFKASIDMGLAPPPVGTRIIPIKAVNGARHFQVCLPSHVLDKQIANFANRFILEDTDGRNRRKPNRADCKIVLADARKEHGPAVVKRFVALYGRDLSPARLGVLQAKLMMLAYSRPWEIPPTEPKARPMTGNADLESRVVAVEKFARSDKVLRTLVKYRHKHGGRAQYRLLFAVAGENAWPCRSQFLPDLYWLATGERL
jgi:hypothetical protein